jgi:diguanylate cyclase (GGDEF)-like protein
MRSAMREALSDFSVVEATDEVTTVALAAACRPNVLVLDATDGDRAARTLAALRNDFRVASTSTVYVVDRAPVSGALGDAVGGADDYVVCPFDDEELSARVQMSLRRATTRRAVNPLSGLPGNTAVIDELRARSEGGREFACLYVDLDDFKSFNDRHGFARGDELIRGVASCVMSVLEDCSPSSCFAGHVGGDDFVVLTAPGDAAGVAEGIVACFEAEGNGCSISVGVVGRAHAIGGPDEIARAAASAKAEAKRREGSSWAFYGPTAV